jgi:hypothetical protein
LEPVRIEAFIPEAAVEAFYVAVSNWLARLVVKIQVVLVKFCEIFRAWRNPWPVLVILFPPEPPSRSFPIRTVHTAGQPSLG